MPDPKINGLLKDNNLYDDFVSKYNEEKELELERCLNDDSISVEVMDIEEDIFMNNGQSGNLTSNSLQASEQIMVGEYDQN